MHVTIGVQLGDELQYFLLRRVFAEGMQLERYPQLIRRLLLHLRIISGCEIPLDENRGNAWTMPLRCIPLHPLPDIVVYGIRSFFCFHDHSHRITSCSISIAII